VLATATIACGWDLRTRRIPNALTFGAAAAGVAFQIAVGGWAGFGHSVTGWVVGLALFIVPFALGGLGGGDVKLLAALGAWLGPVETFWVFLYTGVAGGILALIVAIYRGYLRQALANIWLLLSHWKVVGVKPLTEVTLEGSRGPRLAYAVPILAGTVLALWLR
jgi:prepilin peptidase CpaA